MAEASTSRGRSRQQEHHVTLAEPVQSPDRTHPGEKDGPPPKSSLGVLNPKDTAQVPGSVILLTKGKENKPLGLPATPARTSASSMATGITHSRTPLADAIKTTAAGDIILEPQPEESANDPLNWSIWRRDAALVSLGLYCMVCGGMTPVIAAGFQDVADEYGVDVTRVALTTGLYMMGLAIGNVIMSPTAILYGKRPVYLASALGLVGTSAWCAASPTFTSLMLARICQGIVISPVECLPSATIAEIYFLHERAFRIGIYTMLLLGGKNLVPLVSAMIIERFGWRAVFWVVAMIGGFCGVLLFIFVPETFWDRAPLPKSATPRPGLFRRYSSQSGKSRPEPEPSSQIIPRIRISEATIPIFTHDDDLPHTGPGNKPRGSFAHPGSGTEDLLHPNDAKHPRPPSPSRRASSSKRRRNLGDAQADEGDVEGQPTGGSAQGDAPADQYNYTHTLRQRPAQTFVQQLRVWNGRLTKDSWLRVAVRPFILFTYPAVTWASFIYGFSVGWLIVISECMSIIFQKRVRYHYGFNAQQTGLVYVSPFVGGVLGTSLGGRLGDFMAKLLASRNMGIYEPEFRIFMLVPVLITTVSGLMGFGWSAEAGDGWIVPTIFFGLVSFGCSLGSTTAITFCVDSYRQYAGEALVSLNLMKNLPCGLLFSFFVTEWLTEAGAKQVFLVLSMIHLAILLTGIPMYFFGKRARMWTVRRNFMERF